MNKTNIIDRAISWLWRKTPFPNSRIKTATNTFVVPRAIKYHYYKSTYQVEEWFSELLKILHDTYQIQSVIDVGVNIGQTLIRFKTMNRDVRYLGFEPNVHCVSMVEKIIELNDFKNTAVIPTGLYDAHSLLKFPVNNLDTLDPSTSLIQGFREASVPSYKHVPVVAYDQLAEDIGFEVIDLIKIDIEGGELEAIIGMRKTLEKKQPLIIIEVLPAYDASNEFRVKRQDQLWEILSSLGYSLFSIRSIDAQVRLLKMDSFPIHSDLDHSNYLILPKDKITPLIEKISV